MASQTVSLTRWHRLYKHPLLVVDYQEAVWFVVLIVGCPKGLGIKLILYLGKTRGT